MANQVACILHGEQIFTSRHRACIDFAQSGLQFVVEWIACFFIPKQGVLRQRLAISDGCFEIKSTIGIDRQLLTWAKNFQNRLNARAVIGQTGAANFHFHDGVATL